MTPRSALPYICVTAIPRSPRFFLSSGGRYSAPTCARFRQVMSALISSAFSTTSLRNDGVPTYPVTPRSRIAGTGRDHRAAERERARLEHRAGRREEVGESVDHAVAGAKPAGEEAARGAPPVAPAAFQVVGRPGRDEELGELLDRRGVQAAQR